MAHSDSDAPDVNPEQLEALGAIAGAYAAGEPHVYKSDEWGAVEISAMHPQWRDRAAEAITEGRRPANPPRTAKALKKR